MAEIVEKNLQTTVSELFYFKVKKILSEKEVRKLVQKRREYEYKAARTCKRKEDFMDYILFEMKLIQLLALRLGERMPVKSEVLVKLVKRNNQRLNALTKGWAFHEDMWDFRVAVMKATHQWEEVSLTYADKTRYHPEKEHVWLEWAKWEIEQENFIKAREIVLSKATLYHRNSLSVTKEYFRIEILFIEFIRNRNQEDEQDKSLQVLETREKIVNYALPLAIYEEAKKVFQDSSLFYEFYKVVNKYPHAVKLRELIYRDMMALHPRDSKTWEIKAQRAVEGILSVSGERTTHLLNDDSRKAIQPESSCQLEGEAEGDAALTKLCELETPFMQSLTEKEKIFALFKTFDDALSTLGDGFFQRYIDVCLNLLHKCWGDKELTQCLVKNLVAIFKRHKTTLSSYHFYVWLQIARFEGLSHRRKMRILESALSMHPSDPLIVLTYLQYVIESGQSDELLMKAFHETESFLKGKEGAGIWKKVIGALSKRSSCEGVYRRGEIHTDVQICKEIRTFHLERICTQKGCDAAYSYYAKWASVPPFSSSFHGKMVELLLKQVPVALKEIRCVFEKAVFQLKKTYSDIWLCYYVFEKKLGNSIDCSLLHQRAQAELDGPSYKMFSDLVSLLPVESGSMEDFNMSKFFVEEDVLLKDDKKEFKEDFLSYMFSAVAELSPLSEEQRKEFFTLVENTKKAALPENLRYTHGLVPVAEENCWKQVIEILVGEPFPLRVREIIPDVTSTVQEATSSLISDTKKIHVAGDDKEENIRRFGEEIELPESNPKKRVKLTHKKDQSIEEILKSSVVLQPDFLQKKALEPLVSKRQQQIRKKKEQGETAGPGWFCMKAPEITKELERDLQLLQCRSVMDPSRRYKPRDMEKLPKFFQVGTYIDAPGDFYSSRIPKKQRSQSFAEEILRDEKIMYHQKKQYKMIREKQAASAKINKKVRKALLRKAKAEKNMPLKKQTQTRKHNVAKDWKTRRVAKPF